jgi:predicted deacylase
MSIEVKESTIPITNLGGINLELPMLTLGSGDGPKVLILNNLHGNEVSGFYILQKMLEQLEEVNGELNIITTANPLGLMNKHRLMPLDYVDLNRGYPAPNKSRGIHVAVKEMLMEMALEQDYVLDIHTFVRPSLSAGMAFSQATDEYQKLQDDFLNALDTDIVYEMNTKGKEEKRVASALGPQLAERGKWMSIVEYPPSTQLSEEDVDRYAKGLKNGLAVLGLIEAADTTERNISRYKRQQIISRQTGFFIPVAKLGSKVNEGDLVGYVLDSTLKKYEILSSYNGVLAEIGERTFYLYGDKLVTVAGEVE